MILTKGTANTVAPTLNEKLTINSPNYLFIFEYNGTEYPVIAADEATVAQQVRFNKFTITEGVDDPTNGSLILGPTGTYHYFIYAQASSTNLDKDLADELVERGEMQFVDDESSAYVQNILDVKYVVNE